MPVSVVLAFLFFFSTCSASDKDKARTCNWTAVPMASCPVLDGDCRTPFDPCLPKGVEKSQNGKCLVPLCNIGGYDWLGFPANYEKSLADAEWEKERRQRVGIACGVVAVLVCGGLLIAYKKVMKKALRQILMMPSKLSPECPVKISLQVSLQ